MQLLDVMGAKLCDFNQKTPVISKESEFEWNFCTKIS